MTITSLRLTNFRTYRSQQFTLAPTTIIVGPNTIGKTNIIEAIHMLSIGKSFRADRDIDTVTFEQEFARIEAEVVSDSDRDTLTLLLVKNHRGFHKRFLINNVGKRHLDASSVITSVLFAPNDLDIISESPGTRRRYIDSILVQAHAAYRRALTQYEKALKQRNRLLTLVRDGKKVYSSAEFEYWNNLLLEHARVITEHRAEYVRYLNDATKNIFQLNVLYDHSIFSRERLEQYRQAEQAAGITLIGPQRDDFLIHFADNRRVKEFASRGEQRMSVLQLKLLEINYLKKTTQRNPILLLDDIYSELDQQNIDHIMHLLPHQQTIITTTHEDFIPEDIKKSAEIIDLPKLLQSE